MTRSRSAAVPALAAFALLAAAVIPAFAAAPGDEGLRFRPPAVPLVTHTPYFSIWSASDALAGSAPRHWTGRSNAMSAIVRVDGQAFRLMGPDPRAVPAMEQTGLAIHPTRSVYTFAGAGVEVGLTFLSPLLVKDLDILSRPVTYVWASVRSVDGKEHAVRLYYDACAEIAVNTPDQAVVWGRAAVPGLEVMSFGSRDQAVLEKRGDDLRIDWGYLYLAAPRDGLAASAIGPGRAVRRGFAADGTLPPADDTEMPRSVSDDHPVAAAALDFGTVAAAPVARHLMLAYDERFPVEYFRRRLRPYWRRNGATAASLLATAEAEAPALLERCRAFDAELIADTARVGGEKYAFAAALAYRQSIAAHALAADVDGTPLFFPKENFSNGCISTVDVIYPEAPLFLLMNPVLVRGLIIPVFEYAGGPEWKFPFAPHDLGTYPLANGQVYGGGALTEEDQMPVEESGNMIILVAALARAEGRPDFAVKYWDRLSRWAAYLRDKGLDPENQLCTDDFAGHLAHNANLSVKAIVALRAYADLCARTGRKADAASYERTARDYAAQWVKKAAEGDHFRLAFDAPGTWSQKYNLVWDKILGYGLFPPDVARREIAFYLKTQNAFGLPLDNRRDYTKLDWILWTATLAETRPDFDAFVAPVFDFLVRTPDRVPMTDWYDTRTARKEGFQARSVVGGVLIKMLAESWGK